MPDFKDYYLKLNRRNPLVRLDAVIDTVCDGICEFYCKDHSQCTVANGDCFLMDLMKEQKRVEQENKRIEEEARKKAEEEAESESDV